MEGIELEHFHALAQTETSATLQARKCRAVFHSFFLEIENKILTQLLHTANT